MHVFHCNHGITRPLSKACENAELRADVNTDLVGGESRPILLNLRREIPIEPLIHFESGH